MIKYKLGDSLPIQSFYSRELPSYISNIDDNMVTISNKDGIIMIVNKGYLSKLYGIDVE